MTIPAVDRFWSKVEKSDSCWLWTGSTSKKYGQITVDGKRIRAHRFSYTLQRGPIPSGLFVCHTCDVPHCVNPDHLFLGTNRDNLRDMTKKNRGRWQKGGPTNDTDAGIVGVGYPRRNKLLTIRLTPRELKAFAKAARYHGLTMSTAARSLFLSYIRSTQK